MIDTALNDTREHLGTLSEAKDRPHVLDDATIDRVEQVPAEQMDYVEIYTQQISRWRNEKPSAAQSRELDRMDEQNQQLRGVTADVLALVPTIIEAQTIRRFQILARLAIRQRNRPVSRFSDSGY